MTEMTEIRRRRGRKASPGYPDAKEFLRRRREFLALLAKGALGAGVFGLIGCDSGSGETLAGVQRVPVDTYDTVEDVVYPGNMDVPDPEETWDSGGIQPPPPDVLPPRKALHARWTAT